MNEYTETSALASPSPSEATPPVSTDEVTETLASFAYEKLAQPEDISEYAKQREDVDALRDGKELHPEQMAEARRRTHKALHDAAREAAGILPPQENPEYTPRDARSDDYYPEQSDPHYQKKEGAAAERVRQHFGNNQQRKQEIVEWHQAMDPECKTATWLIENDSPIPGQIMDWTANNPEALQQIAALPARQRDIALAHLQRQLMAQESFAQQARQQQQWEQAAERRVSHAPPPIRKMPGGGALPPRDLHALARTEDISDYAAMRKQQDKRSRE